MAVVLLALGVPLGMDVASVRTQRVFLDRLEGANRLVAVAEQAVQSGDVSELAAQLARYDDLYGTAVAVLDRGGRVRAASRPGLEAQALGRRAAVALTGAHGEPPRAIWPWTRDPLVVAEPVIDGGEVVGAVVTMSPTSRLRRAIARAWLTLGIGELSAVLGCVLLASRLARWILRPVHEIDVTAHAIASGRMAARAPDAKGPPELRRLASSFNQMAALVERQRCFLADASHQLRNPLHALLLRLDALALRGPDAEADAAAREGRHLAAVLERLLQLAQPEDPGAPPQRVDLVPIVEQRIGAWSAAARSKRMTIRRAGGNHVEALADPVALSSALDAVIDNAVKFGPPGSTVCVSVDRQAGGPMISVRDEGPGLRPDELRRASDRFWRRPQSTGGSGLGLAIARTLLDHGGARLDIRSGEPRGLEVLLRFPPTSNLPQIRAAAKPRARIVRAG